MVKGKGKKGRGNKCQRGEKTTVGKMIKTHLDDERMTE